MQTRLNEGLSINAEAPDFKEAICALEAETDIVVTDKGARRNVEER